MAASFDSLRAAGYVITTVSDLSNEAQQQIWPTDPPKAYMMIVLQKGSSTAVCTMPAQNFVDLVDERMTSTTLCYQR
ncbi:MAG: hypothetical protein ACHP7N_17340 [Caulobacterales bacterium]